MGRRGLDVFWRGRDVVFVLLVSLRALLDWVLGGVFKELTRLGLLAVVLLPVSVPLLADLFGFWAEGFLVVGSFGYTIFGVSTL